MYSYTSADVPFAKEGLGTDTVWLGGGRVGVGIAAHGGIEKIIYYGRQGIGRSPFFAVDTRSAYNKLFVPYLLVGEKAYLLQLNETEMYPGGYRSRFVVPVEGIEVEHDLVLVTDAILQTVRVIRNARKKPLRLRISWHEYTRANRPERKWSDWKKHSSGKAWTGVITDRTTWDDDGSSANPGGTTWFGVVAEKPITTRIFRNGRRYFETSTFESGAVTVSALFGHNEGDFRKRIAALSRSASKESAASIAGWEKQVQEVPKLKLGIRAVESFFRLSPLMQESVMPDDLPGGMRASAGTYWVWGWDTLVFCDAYLLAGQAWFLKDALDLYHRTAHPTKGVGHQFTIDMKVRVAQAPAAQGLYAYALYQYVAYTGDRKTLAAHYPLIRTILNLAKQSRARANMFSGPALFPDYPVHAGHNGHDLSVFNNSIFYQAARTIEHLAGWMNDAKTAAIARSYWQDLKKSFGKFWDKSDGYWYDSLDSRTLAPRKAHPSHALLCFSPFADELLLEHSVDVSRFFANKLVFKNGLRMYPLESKAFNGDGNQLGQHYPVGGDLLFLKSSALEGRQELLDRWLDWMRQFWDLNTVPEGVTVEAENEGPQYPDAPGGKQPFSGKSWYMGICNVILGASFDAGGITFGPGLDKPVEIDGLVYGGRRWNLRTHGKGKHVRSLRVNGREIIGTCKIPVDVAQTNVMKVVVTRGANPSTAIQLLSADGAKLTKWQMSKTGYRARIDSPGPVFIRFYSKKKPVVTWKGRALACSYVGRTGQATVLLASEKFSSISGLLTIETAV